jgi:small-conductance mechanosensitive channel/CRP-like cAMP-binding protein
MPALDADPFGWLLYGGKGTVTALVLLLPALLFVTGPPRRRILWALLYLVGHLLLLALGLFFPADSTVRFVLRLGALFLLVSSIGLTLFLLLTQSRLSRAVIRTPPKIFLDLAHGFVYLVALLVTLSESGVKPVELFAGSALLTAVIGLSLRDTLGNLFAGLAIEAQQPFDVGDWIQFNQDATQIGRVVEINWRATKVQTTDGVEIVVPNAFLATAPIINFSRPERRTRRQITVHAPYDVPPQRVHRIILTALVDIPGVLAEPKPSVLTLGFDDRGVQYAVRFYLEDFANRGRIESAVRDRVWYALGRQGIDIPVPPRTVRLHKVGQGASTRREERRVAQQERALRCVDFFERLPEDARLQLAGLAQTRLYAEQEIIIQQGDLGDELFIIEYGEVAVTLGRPGEPPVEVARLGPGDFFGEMSLLTGAARSATVRAVRECEVLVVGKSACARILQESPELAEQFAQVVSRRQAGLNRLLAESTLPHPQTVEEHGNRLLQAIKEFFSV